MKKNLFLSLILARGLSSCTNKTMVACYQCYYGSRRVSNARPSFGSIQEKKLNRNLKDTALDSYYFSVKSFTDQHDYLSFQQKRNWKEHTPDKIDFSPNTRVLYFFAQIPSGYRAYKRNNIQALNRNGEKVLLTDNFFFYRSRPELSICYIDVVKDKETSENVFSFYYTLPIRYKDQRKTENIRAFLSDQEREEPKESI